LKIAVLSDVHGNVPALEAVLDDVESWQPDRLVVNGDLVSRGPCSLACLDMVRDRFPGVHLLAGNHETFVIDTVDRPQAPDAPTFDMGRFAEWTARQLGDEIDGMRAWADHLDLAGLEGGSSVHVTHASRRGNRDGIRPETPDHELPEKLGDPRALFITSHTHRPLERRFNGTLIVNTGSVGQPLDGDPRASYARFTFRDGAWQARVTRVAYDKPSAERDFHSTGFLEECGPVARLIYRELRESRMHVGPWVGRYLQAVKARQTTVAEAVDAYMQSL